MSGGASEDMVLPFAAIGAAQLDLVGGKGGNLGELRRAGLPVPDGFCVTTAAFRRALGGDDGMAELLEALAQVPAGDVAGARRAGEALRARVRSRPLPAEIGAEILRAWERLGVEHRYAVRSSATAEDLPHASFAGQQDTYLNVLGAEALLERVRDCWASLYTDRAILYRIEQRIPHREVALCVVVQRMIEAEKAGVLFTAHPLTGHRRIAVIEAGWGLGESLVSGLISPDRYEVDRRDGRVRSTEIGDKAVAIRGLAGGGTEQRALGEAERRARVLDDREIQELTAVGSRVEALRGGPQDIEWGIAGGELHVLQARPITSLFPLVESAPADGRLHIHVCFNHFQVMTDAMPPMALHVWQLLVPMGKPRGAPVQSPWAHRAGGRIFVDFSELLRSPIAGPLFVRAIGLGDRLSQAAARAVMARPEFKDGPRVSVAAVIGFLAPWLREVIAWALIRPTEGAVTRTTEWVEEEAAAGRRALGSGAPLPERVRAARRLLAGYFLQALARVPPMIMAGMLAGGLLRALVDRPDPEFVALGRGLSGNVTTEMDLTVGDLADAAREHPEVAARLMEGGAALESLAAIPGSGAFLRAFEGFLDRYGARAPSEIDVSRPRYRDAPGAILAAVAGNLRAGEPGSHRAHHARLVREAEAAAAAILEAAARGPLGWARLPLARRLIAAHRGLTPVREHPKLLLVHLFDAVRQLALEAGAALTAEGRLDRAEDVFFLDLDELEAALLDPEAELRVRVNARREDLARFQAMAPPRVMTSEGEIPSVEHAASGAPSGALVGSPASAGVVEGRARVINDPATEVLEKGEILVAPFTDPGWTPLFVNAAGLVMEVGGMMTHGSVVAREYGIPAVVCVPGATRRIRTGQRIRVHGDGGYVEILEDAG